MIDKFDVSLRIIGYDIDLKKISKELNRKPDISHKKGDIYTTYNKNGKKKWSRVYQNDMWCMIFSDDGMNLEQMLQKVKWFIVENKESFIHYKKANYKVDVFCGVWYSRKDEKFIIPADITMELQKMNIEINLDEYWL